MQQAPRPADRAAGRLTREVLALVGLVLVVHVLFIAGHFLADIGRRSDAVKAGYAAAWTLATLFVVLRGLARVRAARLRQPR